MSFGQVCIEGEGFARCLLAGVGTLACGLAYLLGKELFDERVGNLAAAMTAVSPVMAGFSVEILSETLFAATLLANVRMTRRARVGSARHATH